MSDKQQGLCHQNMATCNGTSASYCDAAHLRLQRCLAAAERGQRMRVRSCRGRGSLLSRCITSLQSGNLPQDTAGTAALATEQLGHSWWLLLCGNSDIPFACTHITYT